MNEKALDWWEDLAYEDKVEYCIRCFTCGLSPENLTISEINDAYYNMLKEKERNEQYLRQMTEADIDKIMNEYTELGRKVTEYLEQYVGTDMYPHIQKAIQFGLHLDD